MYRTGLSIYDEIKQLREEISELAFAIEKLNSDALDSVTKILTKSRNEKINELSRLEGMTYLDTPSTEIRGCDL